MQRALTLASAKPLAVRDEALHGSLEQVRTKANQLDDLLTELTVQKEGRAKEALKETEALYQSSRSASLPASIGAFLSFTLPLDLYKL